MKPVSSRSKCLPKAESSAHHGEKLNYSAALSQLQTNTKSIHLLPPKNSGIQQYQKLKNQNLHLHQNRYTVDSDLNTISQSINYDNLYTTDYVELLTELPPPIMFPDMNEKEMFRGFAVQDIGAWPKSVTTQHTVGEELNTPVKEKPKPEFNIFTNTSINQSEKVTSESMLNKHFNIAESLQQQKLFEKQSNKDLWYSDHNSRSSIDSTDDQPLFSPTESTINCSTNSPLFGLNAADPTEESFIFKSTSDGEYIMPVKYSQDCEDFTAEINQICQSSEFQFQNEIMPVTNDIMFKIENDSSIDLNENFIHNSQTNNGVLYHDTMITTFTPMRLFDEDTYLETVNNFGDILIKSEKPDKSKHFNNSTNNDIECDSENDECNTQLTPAPSPKSSNAQSMKCIEHCSNINDNTKNSSNICSELITSTDPQPILVDTTTVDFSQLRPEEDRLHLEHNYNISISDRENDLKIILKRKLVMENKKDQQEKCKEPLQQQQQKRSRRLPPIKIKMPTAAMRIRSECEKQQMEISTPEITNDILEMENEKFDLISYINSYQEKPKQIDSPIELKTEPAFETFSKQQHNQKQQQQQQQHQQDPEPDTTIDLEELIRSTSSPIKRRRISYENPGSVQSITSSLLSDDSSSCVSQSPAPKRRGRPPKTSSSMPSPSQYRHLSEADWRYLEMRNKNNEASRRSRINRKDRETQNEKECSKLERQFQVLHQDEQALIKECAKWRKAVMTLAQM